MIWKDRACSLENLNLTPLGDQCRFMGHKLWSLKRNGIGSIYQPLSEQQPTPVDWTQETKDSLTFPRPALPRVTSDPIPRVRTLSAANWVKVRKLLVENYWTWRKKLASLKEGFCGTNPKINTSKYNYKLNVHLVIFLPKGTFRLCFVDELSHRLAISGVPDLMHALFQKYVLLRKINDTDDLFSSPSPWDFPTLEE